MRHGSRASDEGGSVPSCSVSQPRTWADGTPNSGENPARGSVCHGFRSQRSLVPALCTTLDPAVAAADWIPKALHQIRPSNLKKRNRSSMCLSRSLWDWGSSAVGSACMVGATLRMEDLYILS